MNKTKLRGGRKERAREREKIQSFRLANLKKLNEKKFIF